MIVKKLDENAIAAVDHLGWRLWCAARLWKSEFDAGMAERGLTWFTEARSGVMQTVGAGGSRQSDLGERLGLTKQAVQQLVDDLVEIGALLRKPDPKDARAKRVVLTRKGAAALAAANEVKRAIEAQHRERIGPKAFEALIAALRSLAPDPRGH